MVVHVIGKLRQKSLCIKDNEKFVLIFNVLYILWQNVKFSGEIYF